VAHQAIDAIDFVECGCRGGGETIHVRTVRHDRVGAGHRHTKGLVTLQRHRQRLRPGEQHEGDRPHVHGCRRVSSTTSTSFFSPSAMVALTAPFAIKPSSSAGSNCWPSSIGAWAPIQYWPGGTFAKENAPAAPGV